MLLFDEKITSLPTAASSKPQVIQAEKPRETKKVSDEPRTPKNRPAPAIKLAPMPTVDPATPRQSEGPAAQKPDLKLSPDALRAGGSKPLSEYLRKHGKGTQTDKATPSAPGTPVSPQGLAVPNTDKVRRRIRPVGEKEPEKKVPTKDKMAKEDALLGGREARQLNRKKTTRGRRGRDDGGRSRRTAFRRRSGVSTAAAA